MPEQYVTAVLAAARLERAKGVNKPVLPGRGTPQVEEAEALDEAQHHRYRTLVGKLMWLLCTRPDL
eukprot:14161830-Heterocapsa_arctica.AAC.1